jgi:hypothetical protein
MSPHLHYALALALADERRREARMRRPRSARPAILVLLRSPRVGTRRRARAIEPSEAHT